VQLASPFSTIHRSLGCLVSGQAQHGFNGAAVSAATSSATGAGTASASDMVNVGVLSRLGARRKPVGMDPHVRLKSEC